MTDARAAAAAIALEQPPAAALSIHGVSKTYNDVTVLSEASFDVKSGQIHCLLGGNGSGKSTLIKILAGVVRSDPHGTITVHGVEHAAKDMTPELGRKAHMRFVHQHPGLFPEMAVADNLAMDSGFPMRPWGSVDRESLNDTARQWLERVGLRIDPRVKLKTLSPVTRTMIAIARALKAGEDGAAGVLVLDEPTATLPAKEIQELHDTLRSMAAAGETILYVTHDMDEVLNVADGATVLRDGRVTARLARDGMNKQSLVRAIVGRELPSGLSPSRADGPADASEVVLEVENLSVGSVSELSFSLRRGEVTGIAALAAGGQTEILRCLFGAMAPEKGGVIRLNGREMSLRAPSDAVRARIAYVPADRHADAVFSRLSLRQNITAATVGRYWRLGNLRDRAELDAVRAAIAQFQIKTESPDHLMSRLSGGNQQKAVLARWMETKPEVLLLDEPTQGVDIGARGEIHVAIRKASQEGATVLLTTGDYEELAMLCDRVFILRDGRIHEELRGSDVTRERITHLLYAGAISA